MICSVKLSGFLALPIDLGEGFSPGWKSLNKCARCFFLLAFYSCCIVAILVQV